MIGFCPLASGSKGNCIYLGTKQTKILIDAGISAKQISFRLQQIDVNLEEIDAVIVTHEHTDHIRALKILNEKYNIPIFANRGTIKGIYQALCFTPKCKIFTTNETFFYQDLIVHPFSISHDTLDPVGLKIQAEKKRLGICTDLGFISTSVKKNLLGAHLLFLEANHHPPLVLESRRPELYKNRVLGRQGHLSNQSCAELIEFLHNDDLQLAYLAHLSHECNTEKLAIETVFNHLEKHQLKLDLHIAYQEKISKPFFFT